MLCWSQLMIGISTNWLCSILTNEGWGPRTPTADATELFPAQQSDLRSSGNLSVNSAINVIIWASSLWSSTWYRPIKNMYAEIQEPCRARERERERERKSAAVSEVDTAELPLNKWVSGGKDGRRWIRFLLQDWCHLGPIDWHYWSDSGRRRIITRISIP